MTQTIHGAFGILMDCLNLMDSEHLKNAEKADVLKEMLTHLPIEHVAPNVHRITKAAVERWLHQLDDIKSPRESTQNSLKNSLENVGVEAAKRGMTKAAFPKNTTKPSKDSGQRQREDFRLA